MSNDYQSGAAPSAQMSHAELIEALRSHGQMNIDSEKDKSEFGLLTVEGRIMKTYADDLESAHKREIDELKKQVADLQQQLPKPDPNWRDICAKCFENGATEPPDCKYYTEDGCMSPIPDQHPLIQVGDCAKLREALTKVKEWMEHRIATCGFEPSATFPTMLEDVVLPALAEPPRNCDLPLVVDGPADNNADKAWIVFKRHNPDAYFDVPGLLRCIDWLLAPATEKEGDSDGNE